ncbi:hypothetical protein TNCT_232011 [Trichonephila clavata]|uniref:Uncharacterized protein n=1 Tax=Trichonephila clavata TaxID=2740835 RepID=A0A8X6M3C5_TRICU|nr:hypothetical protein TNCT_232011 [Trichonephila clavata]
MHKDSYNPVLVYKPFGSSLANNPLIKKQDFILGIMTELLELYGKNKIIMWILPKGQISIVTLLATIMVSDDNHEGLPIAICYSNRVNSDVLEPFFEEIKNRLHVQCSDLDNVATTVLLEKPTEGKSTVIAVQDTADLYIFRKCER